MPAVSDQNSLKATPFLGTAYLQFIQVGTARGGGGVELLPLILQGTVLYMGVITVCFLLCRFGGAEFPPIIMFKIFIHSGGQGVKYYCGKRVIKPASEVSLNTYSSFMNLNCINQWLFFTKERIGLVQVHQNGYCKLDSMVYI